MRTWRLKAGRPSRRCRRAVSVTVTRRSLGVAADGFNCRVDTLHGIWWFCPTTVIAATDCGLGGFCFDAGPCRTGCGRASLKNNPNAEDNSDAVFCSAASLIFGPDQTYDYVDCARSAGRATYLVVPTAALTTTTTPSSTPPSSRSFLSLPNSTATSVPTPNPSGLNNTSAGNGSDSGFEDSNSSSDNGGRTDTNNTGAIVGGTIGGRALVVGCIIAVVYLLRNNLALSIGRPVGTRCVDGNPERTERPPVRGWLCVGNCIPRKTTARVREDGSNSP
ncbi:hypothetical protein C8A03DRAFT_44726 [Achaetomium macrosporum]|uniref:Uncharacterized protein n=1 Tax=Achaetomium macrosporum TaxID=79813 RepID=A0AAN7C8L5_9PEZI|nr:hypothetical protein C8A03DRAFT_44726 [Achaetomium macrosporum]